MIPVELQVVAPGTDEVLTEVQVGQNMALRIRFDNTANNSKPYLFVSNILLVIRNIFYSVIVCALLN